MAKPQDPFTDNIPIRVCSHRRSGTHFFMASLHKNFVFDEEAISDNIVLAGQTWHTGDKKATVPWQHLQGGHLFYEDYLEMCPKEKMIYIVRHPVDCLYSVSIFDKITIGCAFAERIIRRWYKHTKGYTDNVFFVRYEDLKDPSLTQMIFKAIQYKYNLTPKRDRFVIQKKLVGWSPNEGKSDYSDRISQDNIDRVWSIVPEGYLGYVKSKRSA